MRRIGIIGGMGPQATIDLYQKIVNHRAVSCDQEHIPVVIDSYPQIEDRTAYILGHGENPCPRLIESAQRLQQAGADALIMSCNTAHYFAEEIRQSVDIPLLHIAEVTVMAIRHKVPKGARIAILATDGTLKAQIYHHKLTDAGFEVCVPDEAHQFALMGAIYDGAKQGKLEAYVSQLQNVMNALSADAYLLGCTELPLFLPWLSAYTCIDATDELAKAALSFALGE